MIRAWIGVALLAVSWLLGTGYYFPANRLAWVAVVVAGVALLGGSVGRGPRRREAWIALVLLLPAVWFAPWPLRAAPLLIWVGLVVELLPIPRRWPRWLGRGAVAAGVVMLAQWLSMAAYTAWTARSHELPWPLPDLLAGVARLLGVEAVADGSTVVMHSIRQVHRLGATWELLLDPPTLCFFVGSLVILGLAAWSGLPRGRRWPAWLGAAGILALLVALWLPVRAGGLMALYLHRVIRYDPEQPLHVMNQFLSPWVHLLMLLPAVLLAWRLVRLPTGDGPEAAGAEDQPPAAETKPWHYPAAVALLLLAVAVFTTAVTWDPVGTPQQGRVMFVERHSTWEPTTQPYDTKWFGHDSGYNYGAVYKYLSQFFEMSQLLESDKIDNNTLAKCDVLVIKTPTARYSRDEVEAVVRFVQRGGGLLLIGEHTNFENSGTYMNDITRQMGFTFRHDLLFGIESPYDQLYRRPSVPTADWVPHPVVQHLPPMDFAISCSIDPGFSRGRPVILSTGLWSLPPDYHPDNYFPMPQHRPDMRYGAFIQLWATRHGKGRVLAFGDSTIFSNFCAFQPGKAELLRGMVDWLNHRNFGDPGLWLLLLGLLPLAQGLWLARAVHRASPAESGGLWLVLLAGGTCGWVVAGVAVAAVGCRAMPVPVPKPDRALPCVVIDRTTSQVPLCKGADAQGDGKGYGMFEQWIPRLGYYTRRASGPDAFSGDALVVFCPSRSVSPQFRDRLERYVAQGGKLLVVDSPENDASTANSLLGPFGLSFDHDRPVSGVLTLRDNWPGIETGRSLRVTGGEPIARVDDTPVGAQKGSVMAIGFGSLLDDAAFGFLTTPHVWVIQPDANMLFTSDTYVRYNVQFALLRALMDAQPVTEFSAGHVVVDRTISEVPLPEPGTTPEEDDGFGLSEMWISQLGYSRARAAGPDALAGDALVVYHPSRGVDDEFRDRLVEYVSAGGKLLVVDSPDNKASTANDLLKPFGLSVDPKTVPPGTLTIADDEGNLWAEIAVDATWRVSGGKPFVALDPQTPLGTTARYGKGAVTLVGFGSLLNNAGMRGSWDLPPPAKSLLPYDLQTAVLRALMTDQPFTRSLPSR